MNDPRAPREDEAPEAQVSPELALVDDALRTRLLEELPAHESTVEEPRPPASVSRLEPLPPPPRRGHARRLLGAMSALLLGAMAALLLGFVPRSDSGSVPYFETSPQPTTTSEPTESNPQVEEETPAAAVWRTLAWAPVRAAVAYDVQIVRNGEIVFRARTSSARIVIPRAKAPARGDYRWYVWPLVRDGEQLRRGRAVVVARLRVSR